MPQSSYLILFAGWLAWMLPFFLSKLPGQAPTQVDRRARWGVVLQALGYWLIWFGPFWMHRPAEWRVGVSLLFFALAGVISWNSRRALGRQWRVDAGLNADHELIRSGPYAIVRHPIYASMLCMLLGTGFMLTPLWRLPIAVAIFVIGLEIRVRIEDALLASRFGEQARSYQRSVAAYIPGIR